MVFVILELHGKAFLPVRHFQFKSMSPVSSLLWILTGIVDLAHMQVKGKGWMRQAIPSAVDSGQRLPWWLSAPRVSTGWLSVAHPEPFAN